jgi:hypothetical protein
MRAYHHPPDVPQPPLQPTHGSWLGMVGVTEGGDKYAVPFLVLAPIPSREAK